MDMRNPFTKAWNEAYVIYTEDGILDLLEYLATQVRLGNLTKGDADILFEDLMEIFN